MKKPQFAYSINRARDGVYVAKIPALYLVTYGSTQEEALKNLIEAEALHIQTAKEDGIQLPTFEESVKALDEIKLKRRRHGGGRKSIEPSKRRSVGVTIQITKEDKKRLFKEARSEKKTLSTYIYDTFICQKSSI